MGYQANRRGFVPRACWRDGRGALRCRRPGMAFSGFGADEPVLDLPGNASKSSIPPEVFLIAQLNRFKGPNVPAGQKLGETKFDTGQGISSSVAFDAITVVIRRLTGSLQAISDEGARSLLSQARGILTAGDSSGAGQAIQFVKTNVVSIGQTVGAFADSLGLPPAATPTVVLGLSGIKLAMAAGAVGIVGLLLVRRSR